MNARKKSQTRWHRLLALPPTGLWEECLETNSIVPKLGPFRSLLVSAGSSSGAAALPPSRGHRCQEQSESHQRARVRKGRWPPKRPRPQKPGARQGQLLEPVLTERVSLDKRAKPHRQDSAATALRGSVSLGTYRRSIAEYPPVLFFDPWHRLRCHRTGLPSCRTYLAGGG